MTKQPVRGAGCPCHPCQIRFAAAYVTRMVGRGRLLPAKDFFCVDCGGRARDYDHYIDYRPENLLAIQPVCRKCHQTRTVARRSTSCQRGHPYSTNKKGARYCAECQAATVRRYHEGRKASGVKTTSRRRSRVVTIEEGLALLDRKAAKLAVKASA